VTTVDNPTFGVAAGHTGTVRVFQASGSDVPIVPESADSFAEYETYMETTESGVSEHGGWKYLKEALAIGKPLTPAG
jgi:hypothetical protein